MADLQDMIAALPPSVNPYLVLKDVFRSKFVPRPDKIFSISESCSLRAGSANGQTSTSFGDSDLPRFFLA
jgi:hypothetical protein